jgi:argininosuccinate lyase
MGFDGVIENSLDANQLSPIDTGVELVGVAASITLTVGAFVSDLEAQYRLTTPWLTLQEGELTGTSSIMPQKRNPVGINDVRIAASETLGIATTYLFKAHNVPHGVPDYKGNDPIQALARAADTLARLTAVVRQLNFNEERRLRNHDRACGYPATRCRRAVPCRSSLRFCHLWPRSWPSPVADSLHSRPGGVCQGGRALRSHGNQASA